MLLHARMQTPFTSIHHSQSGGFLPDCVQHRRLLEKATIPRDHRVGQSRKERRDQVMASLPVRRGLSEVEAAIYLSLSPSFSADLSIKDGCHVPAERVCAAFGMSRSWIWRSKRYRATAVSQDCLPTPTVPIAGQTTSDFHHAQTR
jgi:hypothetical protein